MDFNDYQLFVDDTLTSGGDKMGIFLPCLGLSGETGEVNDYVKKIYRDRDGHFTPTDIEHLTLELGDILWYTTRLARWLGVTLEEVAATNINKLNKRYNRT